VSGFGLNLYSYRPDVFDTDTRHLVGLFATQAALAMGRTRQVENLSGRTRQVENLSAALETRKMIGQAVGVLMAQYQIDEDRAFEFLVRVSRDGNIKLRDVANGSSTTSTRRPGQRDPSRCPGAEPVER